jgi:GNAT superfamily N-acetyltransferase
VSGSDVNIRPMLPAEAEQVARLHREGIPLGFLSNLSLKFRSAMYHGIASAPDSGVWVAVDHLGRILGFISGTINVSNCYKSVLKRQGLVMGILAIPSLVSFNACRHIWETLFYPKREIEKACNGSENTPEPTAELLSIVVIPAAQGTGTARALSEALETGLKDWSHRGPYRVVTIATDPQSNSYYRKIGFEFVREFQHHGIAMNLYHKDLGS